MEILQNPPDSSLKCSANGLTAGVVPQEGCLLRFFIYAVNVLFFRKHGLTVSIKGWSILVIALNSNSTEIWWYNVFTQSRGGQVRVNTKLI